MDRQDFLAAIGISAATLAVVSFLGCKKDSASSGSSVSGPTDIDFTIDLSNLNLTVYKNALTGISLRIYA